MHYISLFLKIEVEPQLCPHSPRLCRVALESQLREVHGPTGRWSKRGTRVMGGLETTF